VVLTLSLVGGGALAQTAPPGEGSGGVYNEMAPFGDGTVTLTVDPGARGTNEVHVTALGEDGRLMGEVEELQISLSLPEEDIGPLQPEMLPVTTGHSISYARFPFEGEWTVLVTAKIGKFQALSASFVVPIGP
jgi:copper transport protein